MAHGHNARGRKVPANLLAPVRRIAPKVVFKAHNGINSEWFFVTETLYIISFVEATGATCTTFACYKFNERVFRKNLGKCMEIHCFSFIISSSVIFH